MLALIGTHHYDKFAERRVEKVIEAYNPETIFVEGVENWDIVRAKDSELKKELDSISESLPPKYRDVFLDLIKKKTEEFKSPTERFVREVANDSKIIYLDDEDIYRKFLSQCYKDLISQLKSEISFLSSNSKKNKEKDFYMLAQTIIKSITFEYPDTVYNLILQREDNLEEILTKDFKLSEKLAEEFAEGIRYCYKPQNIAALIPDYYLLGKRDKIWFEKVREINPKDAVAFVGIIHAIPEIENNFYNLLKTRMEVKFLPLIDAENL